MLDINKISKDIHIKKEKVNEVNIIYNLNN